MYYEALKQYTPSDTEVYMNNRQLQFFRERLLMELEELNAMINQSLTRIQSIRSETWDPVDLSCSETKITIHLNELDRSHKKRCQVRRALERIDKGSFGYCILTGSEIGIDRLNALPCATLAVETQELLETRPKQTSYPQCMFTFSNRHHDFSETEPSLKDLDYEINRSILSGDIGTAYD
ncbi:MAG: hypothetical protein JEZ12_22265 [Desulfobacterium sp.]|nr:hypothetical protein [Desulfobacterium sp.]